MVRARFAYLLSRALLLLGIALLTSAPAPPPIDTDALFEKIAGVAIDLGVDPDQIEFARFSIYHPTEAAVVTERGLAQDYPFFALVGAVKAAKNQSFGKYGTFTIDSCKAPITAIDIVFAKAGDYASSAKDKASVNAATSAAADIAAQYAKATSDQAKAELVAQLAATIPYFGDIPTICTFAFDTDLAAEKAAKASVGAVYKNIRRAYTAFKNGDVVTGVAALLTLGADKGVACELVDSAVGGGIIGRTPILGKLAKGACKSFAGDVIDGLTGVIKGGVGVVEKGVEKVADYGKALACKVYSLIGSGCSSSPAPPPLPPMDYANTTAKNYCAPFNGVIRLEYTEGVTPGSDAEVPFEFYCGNGNTCSKRPGAPFQCATGEEIAAHNQQERELLQNELDTKLPQWRSAFIARWLPQCVTFGCKAQVPTIADAAVKKARDTKMFDTKPSYATLTYKAFLDADQQVLEAITQTSFAGGPEIWGAQFEGLWVDQCEDDQCRFGVRFIRTGTVLAVQQAREKNPKGLYSQVAGPLYLAAANDARNIVAESRKRSADLNMEITKNASEGWAMLAVGVWSPQCLDQQCRDEIKSLAEKMKLAARLLQLGQPDKSSLAVQGQVSQEYGPKFKAAVDASKQRAAAKTVKYVNVGVPSGTQPKPASPAFPSGTKPAQPGGRPAPAVRPAPAATPAPRVRPFVVATPTPTPTPVLHRIPVRPAPTPTPTAVPVLRRLPIVPTPTPTPTATPVLRRFPLRPAPTPTPTPH